MKKQGVWTCLAGMLIGACLFYAVPVLAANVAAVLSTQPVTVDGKPVQVTAYNIDGSNYFKLRDMAEILDVGVWYDAAENTVRIEPERKYDPNYNGPSNSTAPAAPAAPAAAAGTYQITDYYGPDGKLSALGQALPLDSDGSNALTVKNGEVVAVGDKQYQVTTDSLTLPFYTQPSLDQVIIWWTDYLNDWQASGKVSEVR